MNDIVLYKDVYIIDYENKKLIHKDITDDLNGYIINLVKSIENSDRLQFFQTEDETKQVISNIKTIVNNLEKNNTEDVKNQIKSIASRLLQKEIEAQKKVERLGVNIKRGSLLQTVFYDSVKAEYNYLITKTEHTKYMEETEFSIQSGFKIDEKNLWKSCLVQILKEGNNFEIGDIKVYLDNTAAYWHKEFLEIVPIRREQENTKQLFRNIERILKRDVYSKSKQDYSVLRNALINYIRSAKLIDFYNLIEDIFEGYAFQQIDDESKDKLIKNLKKLTTKNKFDIQFAPDPSGLGAKIIKEIYELTDDIELILKDPTNTMDNISSVSDISGMKYIKIKTNNIAAYETFLSK